MKFYWLKDRAAQGEFRIYWAPGAENLGDYYTKVYPPSHHKKVNPTYLYNKETSPLTMKGCIEILTALKTRTKPMSKYRYKIAARQPNSKSASLANGCREQSSQSNGYRYRINIVNHTRNHLIKLFIT